MGVDIYGRKPKLKYKRPEEDWQSLDDDQQKEYFEKLEKFENDNPGYYFRSNWWGWRPIVHLTEIAMENAGLDFGTEGWHENSGLGLKDANQSMLVANALEHLLAQDDNLEDEDDNIYINLGSWSVLNSGMVDEQTQDKLNDDWPLGTVKFTKIVGDDGNIYYPTHSSPKWLIKEWINFLKECGGFEIH